MLRSSGLLLLAATFAATPVAAAPQEHGRAVTARKGELGSKSERKPEAKPREAPAPAAPPQADAAVPYEPELLHLAEIMGALAYLRDLCGIHDGQDWRAKMSALIESEGATQGRRERLAGAYNRGFRGYETTYRTCTDNARIVISRYVQEGSRLAQDVTSRFGGG